MLFILMCSSAMVLLGSEDNKTFNYSAPNEEVVKSIGEIMNWDYKKASTHNYNWTFKTKSQKSM